MVEVLRCADRWGREIILTAAQWERHLLIGHPELDGNLSSIEAAIVAPDVVMHDSAHPNGENFYRLDALPAPFDGFYLKVCVRFTLLAPAGPWRGEVVTAFPATTIKATEMQKWP
jgi:hypothetical protein